MSLVVWLWLACSKPSAVDADGDGVATAEDCDDNDPEVGASKPEVCDGLDQDCDGIADNDLPLGFFRDADHDGAGNPATESCSGDVQNGDDCDDANADRVPGGAELCDDLDNDCDGAIDEDLPFLFVDHDGDGFGAEQAPDCHTGGNRVSQGGDCDDDDFTVNPGVAERCDGADDDCDGVLDDGLTENTFYADEDADGFGRDDTPIIACAAPGGASALAGAFVDPDPLV
jgi:hypothetical protein